MKMDLLLIQTNMSAGIIDASNIYRDCLVHEIIDLLPIDEASVFRIMTADLRSAVKFEKFPFQVDAGINYWYKKIEFYIDKNYYRAIKRLIKFADNFIKGPTDVYMGRLRRIYWTHESDDSSPISDDIIMYVLTYCFDKSNMWIFMKTFQTYVDYRLSDEDDGEIDYNRWRWGSDRVDNAIDSCNTNANYVVDSNSFICAYSNILVKYFYLPRPLNTRPQRNMLRHMFNYLYDYVADIHTGYILHYREAINMFKQLR